MTAPAGLQIPIRSQVHVERARREARIFAQLLGFDRDAVEAVVLAVSELGTNILRYAFGGSVGLRQLDTRLTIGIEVDSRDEGPGIDDPEAALREEFKTGAGLGSGLAGVRRLMDDFELTTGTAGTRVICRKWRARP